MKELAKGNDLKVPLIILHHYYLTLPYTCKVRVLFTHQLSDQFSSSLELLQKSETSIIASILDIY